MRPIEIHDRGRGPELKGTQITVYDVVYYHLKGRSPNYIAAVLGIATAEVLALLDYFERHREEVLAHHYKIEERNARGNPPEIEERLGATHGAAQARLEQIRRREAAEANGESHPG
jgi:uncharacterized protein (DUF433 family)